MAGGRWMPERVEDMWIIEVCWYRSA